MKNHRSNDIYDARPEEVTKLCAGSDAIKCFENLGKCKNLPLLTRSPLGRKVQVTFFHSVVGIPVMPEDLFFVARMGTDEGTGVELDPKSVFRQTGAIHVPSIVDMMKAENEEDVKALTGDAARAKKKVKCFAVLTPSLGKAVLETRRNPEAAFLAIVKEIKLKITPPAPTAGDPQELSEEDILKEAGGPYEGVLRFIWSLTQDLGDVLPPVSAPLSDPETLAWERETKRQNLAPTPSTVDLTEEAPRGAPASANGAVAAMTKLSESIIKHQEAALKVQEEKSDSRIKAWRKLPKIQQDIILLGGVDEDGKVPEEPTEEMLSILGCQNGAQVE